MRRLSYRGRWHGASFGGRRKYGAGLSTFAMVWLPRHNWPELQHPTPHRFVRNLEPTLRRHRRRPSDRCHLDVLSAFSTPCLREPSSDRDIPMSYRDLEDLLAERRRYARDTSGYRRSAPRAKSSTTLVQPPRQPGGLRLMRTTRVPAARVQISPIRPMLPACTPR